MMMIMMMMMMMVDDDDRENGEICVVPWRVVKSQMVEEREKCPKIEPRKHNPPPHSPPEIISSFMNLARSSFHSSIHINLVMHPQVIVRSSVFASSYSITFLHISPRLISLKPSSYTRNPFNAISTPETYFRHKYNLPHTNIPCRLYSPISRKVKDPFDTSPASV